MIGEQLKHFARVIPPKAGFELRERVALPGNRRFRRFLIVTPGRAGSQMLVQRCNSHQQVTCYGELFATEHINWQTCGAWKRTGARSQPGTAIRCASWRGTSGTPSRPGFGHWASS